MVSEGIHAESEPLLRRPSDNTASDGPQNPPSRLRWVADLTSFLRNNPILLCTFLLQFLTYFSKYMVEVPLIRLFEQAICNRYFALHENVISDVAIPNLGNIDESRCKIQAVQDQVAELLGLKFTFDALPGLITALYYGSVADRFGRRLVLALCCTGTACSLLWILFVCYANNLDIPVNLVWASSVFLLLGGSQRVAKGMNFTIVADTTDPAHRTRFMYLLAGIPHLTTLIAPPLSGLLMGVSVWVPFAVAIGALLLSLLLLLFMPESLDRAPAIKHLDDEHSHDPLLGPGDTLNNGDSRDVEAQEAPPPVYQPSKKEWWRDIATLLRMPGLPFCYVLFFCKPIAMIAKAYVYQYASFNFGWDLSKTTWLRFAQAGGSFFATIMVLPLLSSVLLNRKGLRARQLDMNVIRISLFIAIVGFLMLQFSFRVWMLLVALFICGLGEGEEPALQGLATSLIEPAYHARLFTSVAVVEIVAKLVGGPIMGKLFSISRRNDDVNGSAGICFSASAGILFCLMIFAMFQKLNR